MNVEAARPAVTMVTEKMSAQILEVITAQHVRPLLEAFGDHMGIRIANVHTVAGGFQDLPAKHILRFDVSAPQQQSIDDARSGLRYLLDSMYEDVPPALRAPG